ncbi:MAG: hypothetical protein WBF20_08745, partial [Trebonia sp.]|uniref:hypothetical protein n=1 Tax=Trebonia sp. TaxID=2767075 RepID=UPI003C7967EE
GLPGVLSCGDGAVRVSSGVSDEVLRQVLGWDGAHVTGVRTEQTEPSGQAGPADGPVRAQLAALVAALGGGAVLGIIGAVSRCSPASLPALSRSPA